MEYEPKPYKDYRHKELGDCQQRCRPDSSQLPPRDERLKEVVVLGGAGDTVSLLLKANSRTFIICQVLFIVI